MGLVAGEQAGGHFHGAHPSESWEPERPRATRRATSDETRQATQNPNCTRCRVCLWSTSQQGLLVLPHASHPSQASCLGSQWRVFSFCYFPFLLVMDVRSRLASQCGTDGVTVGEGSGIPCGAWALGLERTRNGKLSVRWCLHLWPKGGLDGPSANWRGEF